MLIDKHGQFEGYASVFSIADQSGDIVSPGAFRKSLMKRPIDRVRLLFQHDPKEPLGHFEQIFEDQKGLHVRGVLAKGVGRARELKDLIASGAIDGLSIGFRTVRAAKNPTTKKRHLYEVDLWEISIVTFPMMEQARIYPRHHDLVHSLRSKSLAGGTRKAKLDQAIQLLRPNQKDQNDLQHAI